MMVLLIITIAIIIMIITTISIIMIIKIASSLTRVATSVLIMHSILLQ